MENKKEMTALDVSAATDTEQPISKCTDNSISEKAGKINDLETISMTELYDTVYPSKPPLIDGLRCFTLDNEKDEVPTKCNSGILEIDNLSVSYKNRTIFSNASFAAARGDIIAVTGRNGSGKSAFLRVLCGLMKEKAGRIVFDGKPYPYKKRRELCYMTMQDVVHQLFSDSVWEEFSLLNKTVDEQEITKILRRLDLFDYKDKHPMTLSGGQKQRLALAVATLANKDIMIFDEPTSGLDYGNMIKVCELIKELSSNRIVFVATHDRELMGLLCTRRMEISNESISVYDLTTK